MDRVWQGLEEAFHAQDSWIGTVLTSVLEWFLFCNLMVHKHYTKALQVQTPQQKNFVQNLL